MKEDGSDLPATRAEERLRRAEYQRADAAKVRAEIATAKAMEQAKTVRLRALRLAKEEADREAAAAAPKKPARKAK